MQALDKGVLTKLAASFSRDAPPGMTPMHVNTDMEAHIADLRRHMENGGHVYVCGGASVRVLETQCGADIR